MNDMSYKAVMDRANEIMITALGVDYSKFEFKGLGFDYEALMDTGFTMEEIRQIQSETGVGGTPLIELKNFTTTDRKSVV